MFNEFWNNKINWFSDEKVRQIVTDHGGDSSGFRTADELRKEIKQSLAFGSMDPRDIGLSFNNNG